MQKYLHLDEKGRITAGGPVRITESTYILGMRLKAIIDQYKEDKKDLSLRQLAQLLADECNYKISYERVRQICNKMKIDKPNAKNGPDAVRVANTCPECNSMLPLIKGTNRPVKICPECKPKPLNCTCNNCGKEFVLTHSQYTTRTSPGRGYKGNLYCDKDCFYELQKKKKWWEASPIFKKHKNNKKRVSPNASPQPKVTLTPGEVFTPILIIATTDKENEWEADAAVLPNGKVLLASDTPESMAEALHRQIKMYREMISDETGKPATGDELLEGVSTRWSNQAVVSKIFGDDEIDEAKKYVKESRMKNA